MKVKVHFRNKKENTEVMGDIASGYKTKSEEVFSIVATL